MMMMMAAATRTAAAARGGRSLAGRSRRRLPAAVPTPPITTTATVQKISVSTRIPLAATTAAATVVPTTTTMNHRSSSANEKVCGAVRSLSTGRSSSSSSSRRTRRPSSPLSPQKKLILPPNLRIDPRSSFAPQFAEAPSAAATAADLRRQRRRRRDAGDADADQNKNEKTDGADRWAMEKSAPGAEADDDDDDGVVDDDDDDYDDQDGDEDDDDDDEALYWSPNEGIVFAKPLPERLHVEIHTLFVTPASTNPTTPPTPLSFTPSSSDVSSSASSSPSSSPSLVGHIHLDASVFGLDPVRVDLLKRAVNYYRARKRGRRTAVTKTIGQVSGSGRKIRPQKGGGVARAGHARPPHYRGGAKAHGPKNATDYARTKLNNKVRRLAVRHVLSQKLKEGNLLCVDQMHRLPTHKTNELARLLEPWNFAGKVGATTLLVDHYYPLRQERDDDHGGAGRADPTLPAAAAASRAGVPANLRVAAGNLQALTVANANNGVNVYSILRHEKLVVTLAALAEIERRLREA